MSTLKNLKKARKLLAETGVGAGKLYETDIDGVGRYCSMGAVVAVRAKVRGQAVNFVPLENDPYSRGDDWPEFQALFGALPGERREGRRPQFGVFQYNDMRVDRERSVDDAARNERVLALFDAAIEKLSGASAA